MEETNDLGAVCAKLQRNQQELDTVTATMKDLPLLQCMMKMGENKRCRPSYRSCVPKKQNI